MNIGWCVASSIPVISLDILRTISTRFTRPRRIRSIRPDERHDRAKAVDDWPVQIKLGMKFADFSCEVNALSLRARQIHSASLHSDGANFFERSRSISYDIQTFLWNPAKSCYGNRNASDLNDFFILWTKSKSDRVFLCWQMDRIAGERDDEKHAPTYKVNRKLPHQCGSLDHRVRDQIDLDSRF